MTFTIYPCIWFCNIHIKCACTYRHHSNGLHRFQNNLKSDLEANSCWSWRRQVRRLASRWAVTPAGLRENFLLESLFRCCPFCSTTRISVPYQCPAPYPDQYSQRHQYRWFLNKKREKISEPTHKYTKTFARRNLCENFSWTQQRNKNQERIQTM